MDEERYKNVIKACCLDIDLQNFGEVGDLLMIGDKGVSLSGGQKARISLARALYADADLYLLDDPLAAVDPKVAKNISDQSIGPQSFLHRKTRILVTHQTHFLVESDQMLLMTNGHIDELHIEQQPTIEPSNETLETDSSNDKETDFVLNTSITDINSIVKSVTSVEATISKLGAFAFDVVVVDVEVEPAQPIVTSPKAVCKAQMSTKELCIHLTELHAKSLLNDNDTFLFDCDGVLWNFPHIFTGAVELLNYLTEQGKRLFFVTNNSTTTQDDYAKRFNDIGYKAKPEQIICTAWLTAKHLKSINFKGKCYVLGMQSMKYELEREGFQICGGIGPDPLPSDSNAVTVDKLELEKDVDCVILAFDLHISYIKILKAATYLNRPNVLFIATNDDARHPQNDEIVKPGTGSILASVVIASCRSPTILGKPHAPMFDAIRLAFPDVDPKRTVMIGDQVETDIAFGNRQGTTTLLVFSRATREKYLDTLKQQVEKHTAERDLLPHFCVKDVEQFLQFLKSNESNTLL
ncbi:unnamed protein product [Rotaria sordida]|uniref:ABC transporter domain-containing protein n=1 Tax=Rotaria sordida TaxID=392033 RepID=A0A815C902_9BILA|nr:unnamed protein product [Rotaria sordida]